MTARLRSLTRLTLRQLGYEQRVYWRTPAAVFFTMAMPVVLLLVFASLHGDNVLHQAHGLRFAQYFVPGMVAFGAMSATYGNLAGRFVFRREAGVLKRVRATPLPTAVLVTAYVANAVIAVLLVTAVLLTAGITLYHVTVPHWPAFALSLVVGAATFSAVGLALANVIPNADTADAIIFGTLMPLLFMSGAFDPIPPGSLMVRVGSLFPVRHLVVAMIGAFDTTRSASAIDWGHLAVVSAWGVAGAAFAIRHFRWEPSNA